jgi:hypothetical protein
MGCEVRWKVTGSFLQIRQQGEHRGCGPYGRLGRFHYLLQPAQSVQLSSRFWHYGNHQDAESLRNKKRLFFLNMKIMQIETYSRQRDLMFHAKDFRVAD